MKLKQPTKSREQFLRELSERDMTVLDWARANGFPSGAVYMVTQGRTQNLRGKSRAIARAMGLALPDTLALKSIVNPQPKKRKAASAKPALAQQGD